MAGAGEATHALPGVIRRALAIDAHNASKSIQDVAHIVVLMQENRSFDHYFGAFPGVWGFGDRFTVPLPDGRCVWQQSNGHRLITPYHLDQSAGNAQRVAGTPHSWSDAQAAWNHGRMTEWPAHKQDQSMGHYQHGELEFQWALADAFTLCDHYHCSLHGGTNPNRLFLWTGTNGPTGAGVAAVVNEWDSLGDSKQGYTWKTYPERLEEAGITWKVFQNLPNNFDDNSLAGFRVYRAANEVYNSPDGFPWLPFVPAMDSRTPLYKGIANTMPTGGLLEDFARDVRLGLLPQVSWIVAPDTYSEHPGPSSPVQGGWYIQQALQALVAVPEAWSKTVLIVNFDENDGFFDHVPPPVVFSRRHDGTRSGASTLGDEQLKSEYFTHPVPPGTKEQPEPDGRPYGPGPRVPCFIVSPWSRGGWVASETFDHTSVLRFIEARFGITEPNINPFRRAVCGDLTSCFDFVDPNATSPALPVLTKTFADRLRAAQESQAQVPIPDEANQALPRQQPGIRPSRALPYELSVCATVLKSVLRLSFANSGRAAAVFHVYDRLHLDDLPRRYMVEAGKQLEDTWEGSGDGRRYDLWVLGPNCFHRHFTGVVAPAGASQPLAEIAVAYDPSQSAIALALSNPGSMPCRFHVVANAYEANTQNHLVAAGAHAMVSFDLSKQGNWYDFTVTVEDLPDFSRRCAGRMENGEPGITDPCAIFQQQGTVRP